MNVIHRRLLVGVNPFLFCALACICLVTVAAAVAQPHETQQLAAPLQGEVEPDPAVAICLYGPAAGMLAVTRSSMWTRVLDVLAYHGWHADVYIHGYDPWIEDVPRAVACAGNASASGEVRDVSMAATAPWRLLQPVREHIDEGWSATSHLHAGDRDQRLGASLAAVTRMWRVDKAAKPRQDRAIIYAR